MMEEARLEMLLQALEEETGLADERAIKSAFDRLRYDIGAFAEEEEETLCAG